MKKESVLLAVVVLIITILGGIIYSNANKASAPDSSLEAAAPAIDHQQNIKHLTELLAKSPDNRNAWVQLGHNYFDSSQPMQAVEAYDKALDLDRNDPDVLTDQGIMYRQLGWFDKAIKNFQEANRLNPNHANALYNLGIVLNFDLGEKEKAREAWEGYLKIIPSGKGADKVRTMLDHMENGHN